MLAGHIGVALALCRLDRRVNPGALVAAALFLDLLLWSFVLLGWESVTIPDNYNDKHQLKFNFSYSHSLSAALIWSVMSGAAAFLWYSEFRGVGQRAVFMVSVAVFSNWLLDFTVHNLDLCLLGDASLKMGLKFWDNMPVILLIEAGIVLAGLLLFLYGARISSARVVGMTLLCVLALAITVITMTIAPPPSSEVLLAQGSLVMILSICLLSGWLGRQQLGTA
ncbi:hypothetical protein [Amphritea pacifica]|uniref:hypothetical protein n=1 Tax=Amphritea pacifica TaxID=2811233 RepID=UPI0019639441|nr:hypothetical protein [Amphritea pacifica]MBN1007445.1 hypothetical protein [Amphritea pacifica]